MKNKLLTVKEVADQLSVCAATIYNLINSGELETIKIRGARRFRQEQIDEYLKSCQV